MIGAADLDPRTKLFIIICFSSLAVIIDNWVFLAVIFLAELLALLILKVSPTDFIKKTKILIYMVIFIALMQSIFTSTGQILLAVGNVNLLTTGGLRMGVEFILRMAIILTSAGILSTSSSREIIQGLVQCKLPYEIAFMSTMGIRFLPVFAEEFREAMIALQLRGIDLKKLSLSQKFEVISSMFQPVVAGAIIKSKAIAMSVEMRGFRAYPTRTSFLVLTYRVYDYVIMIITGLATALCIVWYLLIL